MSFADWGMTNNAIRLRNIGKDGPPKYAPGIDAFAVNNKAKLGGIL